MVWVFTFKYEELPTLIGGIKSNLVIYIVIRLL